MNEACEAAGISRATFYRVATSPADLLADERRRLHERRRGDYAKLMLVPVMDNFPLYVTRVSLVMVDIWQHADIYRESFTQAPSVLAEELVEYFRTGIEDFMRFRGDNIQFPSSVEGFPRDVGARLLSSQFANSQLGVVRGWIEESEEISVDEIVQVHFEVSPAWYLEAIGYKPNWQRQFRPVSHGWGRGSECLKPL